MRCYNCQEFGHIAKVCKGERKCARCGGGHEYGKCGERVLPKCCHCGGGHSIAFWGCIAKKGEIEVQPTRKEERMSYAEVKKAEGEEQSVNRWK